MKKTVYIMSNVPFRGLSKKRLSKDIGFTPSKRLTINNLEKMKKFSINKKKEYEFYWYLSPFLKFRSYSFLFLNNCIIQKGSDLGQKMWHILIKKNNPLIILGSDIPNISLMHFKELFYHLKYSDVVIGPSFDGGFWSIGFSNKKKLIYPFSNVRWSTDKTLSDLKINLKNNKINYKITSKLRDIDNKLDYCENKLGLN